MKCDEKCAADSRCGRGVTYVLLDPGNRSDESTSDEERVSSPLQCLDRVGRGNAEFLVINFRDMAAGQYSSLVELVTVMKHGATSDRFIVALLRSRHRVLLDALEMAGADYALMIGESALDSQYLQKALRALGPEDRPEQHLRQICPHINYSMIDSRLELALCGAYLNRMVLGDSRVHATCAAKAHQSCEYYLNPRPAA